MTITNVLFIVLSTGIITWSLFRLLIGFLFSPQKPINFLRIKIQGIIPGYRKQLIQQVGEWINTQAIPKLQLQEKLTAPGNLEQLMPIIDEHIDDFLRNKLAKEMPMISMFISDKLIEKLKETFMQEIAHLLPKLLGSFAGQLQQKMDATVFLHQLSDNFPDHKIASIFNNSLQKEITKGSIFVLLFGTVAGIVQVIILYFIL
ncbi:MAG: hypothetical protein ACO3AY_03705 [Chitinophagaceae bacterium]